MQSSTAAAARGKAHTPAMDAAEQQKFLRLNDNMMRSMLLLLIGMSIPVNLVLGLCRRDS